MAKSVKKDNTKVMTDSPFLGGLNTELNGVIDSTDFTKDELNMMIRQDNTRSRRPGVDYEELFKFNHFGPYSDILNMENKRIAFNCIEWTDINSPDESQTLKQTPYIVCQVGGYIIFFENQGEPFSSHQKDFAINLKDYRLDETDDESYMTERCKFTTAYGCLFITSNAIKPIRLRSAQEDQHSWTPSAVLPHCRVSCSVASGKETYTEGRATLGAQANAKGYWFFAINGVEIFRMTYNEQKIVYPESLFHPRGWDVVFVVASPQFAQSWNNLPADLRLGITCTPKYQQARISYTGFYDENGVFHGGAYTTPDDWLEFTAPEGSELAYRGTTITWGCDCGTYDRSYKYRNTATMLGGNVYQNQTGLLLSIRDTSIGANDYLDNETQPEKMSYAHLYNTLNQGWTFDLLADYYVSQEAPCFPGNNLAQQYLKDEKTEKFKPEKLINMTFGDTPAARGHYILNFFNQDRNGIVNLQLAMNALIAAINNAYEKKGKTTRVTLEDILDTFDKPLPTTEAEEKAMAAEQVPVVKPRRPYVSDMCAYAGRIFYLCGDVLLYSQIIAEDTRKSNYCYSEADPTSEEISDVVETDGGFMSLPEIGEGIKLQQFGTYLLVFGTRGSMIITGTANNNFTATAYTTGTLPAAPTQAPDSFVETEYGVFYWGTTGIVLVGSGNGGITAQDISTDKILTWFGKLTNTQHKYCKGVYSSSKKKVYWFFPSDDEAPRKLDKVLVFDIMKGAFIPYQIATEGLRDIPEIVSGVALKVPFKNVKEYPVETGGNYFKNWQGFDNLFNVTATSDYFTLDTPEIEIEANIHERVQGAHTTKLVGTISDIIKHTYEVEEEDVTDTYVVFNTVYGSEETQEFFECSVDTDTFYWSQEESIDLPEDNSVFVFDADGNFIGQSTAVDIDNDTFTFTNYRTGESLTATIVEGSTTFEFKPNVIKVNHEKDYTETVSDEEGEFEVVDDNGIKILADDPIETEEFTYESSLLLCLDVANGKVTFGDFRNNNMRDWTSGDWQGPGYVFDSYLISHPMNAFGYGTLSGKRTTDVVHNKNMPYLISYFKRTETGRTTEGGYVYPSKCQGSVLWDWRTNGDYGKWDSPQELYRPNKREIFSEGYVVTKTNIRGIGRAYQVKLESVEDNQFIIEAISNDLLGDGRI